MEKLKSHAIPLEDTPDDVINRALDALGAASSGAPVPPRSTARELPATAQQTRRGRKGNKLPQKEFREPLLNVLYELGGRALTTRIREIMEQQMAPRLCHEDHELVSSGDPRWWNATCWERNDLVKEGLFRDNSNRGTWELSERGIKFVEASLRPQHPRA